MNRMSLCVYSSWYILKSETEKAAVKFCQIQFKIIKKMKLIATIDIDTCNYGQLLNVLNMYYALNSSTEN